ncbi:uncharacterized protein G2W53_012147 [Senna tora]|uniref:Uncharacterized protein n=1 Tax=Senna tora TaxID=362788 RepID=A0A834U3P0_9FABA|nr:uncharacterized protein G2W53_012147 [Senna tora]
MRSRRRLHANPEATGPNRLAPQSKTNVVSSDQITSCGLSTRTHHTSLLNTCPSASAQKP